MINNSLIKVQVQDYTSPTKPQRRLIYQRIKPYMEAYGLSPEFFEIKGKSVVFKTNNPNNQTYLNKSVVSIRSNKKKPKQKISLKRPQTASIQLPNNVILPISNKYANIFNEIKSNQSKPQVQIPQKAEKSLILEEDAEEVSDSSLIKKHEMILKDIADLEKVKQQKINELETIQNKIDEVKNAEINSSRFIIKKNSHKPTLREKKDKAASLIQAHVKGRMDYKRFIEWKKRKEDKLRKLIIIQKWWRIQLNRLEISKRFQIIQQSKQIKLIDGYNFLITTNYSYVLNRIRLLFIERMGIIRGHFRLYLDQSNCLKLLNEDITNPSNQCLYLINIIINNLIQLIQVQDGRLIFNSLNSNFIDIPQLMQQICLQLTQININQYQIIINQADQLKELVISKDQQQKSFEIPPTISGKSQVFQIQDQFQIKEIKEDEQETNQNELVISNQQSLHNDYQEIHQKNQLLTNNIQALQQSETAMQSKNVDFDQKEYYSQENLNSKCQNDHIEMQEKIEQNDFDNSKITNQQINQNQDNIFKEQNQEQGNIFEVQNQELQVSQEQINQFNQQEKTDKEEQYQSIRLDNQKNDSTIQNTDQQKSIKENQIIHSILPYNIQDPLNSQILNQEQNQFQNFITNLINNQIQNDENKLEVYQYSNQNNLNFIESNSNVKFCEGTQIIQNEMQFSQVNDQEKQLDDQEIIKNKQNNQELLIQSKKSVEVEDEKQHKEEIQNIEQENFQEIKQDQQEYIQENLQMKESNQQPQQIIQNDEIQSNGIQENKIEEFEQIKNQIDKPLEIQHEHEEEEEDQQQQIVNSEYIIQQNINEISEKIEKVQQSQNFKKKEHDQNLQQIPSQIDFHMLKSCESNLYDPPNSGKETAKYLNSQELLSRTNFLSQLGQLGKFEYENNSFLGSGDLKKDIEGFLAPVNLRNKNNNQQELFLESNTFPNRNPSDFRSPLIDDTFKLSTTLKFQFSSELKAFESGHFISQQFDIKIQQQDSLEYSMDESQDLQPIYITTIKVDDNDVDVFQIKNMLRLKDKKNNYQSYDFKISKIHQSNCDYIIQNLYVYIINNRINCIEGSQIVRIQRYIKRFRFVQSCLLTFDKESTLVCLFKSFFKIKLSFYRQVAIEEDIIIEKMTIKQRRILERNFYSICPQLLFIEKNKEKMIMATINALEFQI
ncbi:unnamed protein product [Paramecium sonneborni]|uniref:IQ calmodulin-binding motif protein n=1 Tax=Paramecium sonneborni TaxID=65129 RepID=A0A8S1PHV4_9CILI|nr:unnamed protein product [Paramecium sonneborni]